MNVNEPLEAQRPIGDLLRDLTTQLQTLVRQELALARFELSKTGKRAGQTAGFFGAAALFGLGAFAMLTVTFVAALAVVLPLWGAALAVTVAYGAIAAATALLGKQKLAKLEPVPDATLANVREDVATIKEHAERGR